jgi:glycerophosphoryl diester phosphodiesterase
MKLFAHRGSSSAAPENTMSAFRQALNDGADGIEIDVQLTRDGIPIVIHDEKLGRTVQGQGWIKDYSWGSLQKLDAGSWFGPSFQGERIPRLEEFLDWIRPTQLLINIELKNSIVFYPTLEQQVIEKVRQYDLSERVILSSFNHYSLRVCKQLAFDIDTGLLYSDGLVEPWIYANQVGVQALHPPWYWANPMAVREAGQRGLAVRAYTVNEPDELSIMVNAGVDAVFTDKPKELMERLNKL